MTRPPQVAPAETPDRTGPHGRAWKISDPDGDRLPQYAASLQGWLVHQPAGHPFWHFYMVGGVSLRDIPGVDPPKLRFEGATHEFFILALNPEKPVPPVRRWRNASFLKPYDLVHQLILPGDRQATEIIELIVQTAVEKGVALDEDRRGWWEGALDHTAQHYREGRH